MLCSDIDIIVYDTGTYQVGDTLDSWENKFEFENHCQLLLPEIFVFYVSAKNVIKQKSFHKESSKLEKEGATSFMLILKQASTLESCVGQLQFEVLKTEAEGEYNEVSLSPMG